MRDRRAVARLAEAVGELVLEEGRRRRKGRGDGVDGGERLGTAAGALLGKVLEGEEGAEADGERRVFGAETLAQAEDRGGDVLFPRRGGGGRWGCHCSCLVGNVKACEGAQGEIDDC